MSSNTAKTQTLNKLISLSSVISSTFDCTGKKNNFFYKDPENAHYYFECVGGKAVNFTCPEDLVFDDTKQVCDYPKDSNGTTLAHTTQTVAPTKKATTAAPATTAPPTTAPPTTAPPTTKATTAAPTTKAPTAAPTTAPTTHNPITTAGLTTKPTATASTQKPTTDAIAAKECAGKPDGFHRDPKDDHKYFECAGGRGFQFVCPENLVFNEISKACDYSITPDPKATTTAQTTAAKTTAAQTTAAQTTAAHTTKKP